MPILNDIMDHQVLGPAIRQGRQEGRRNILRSQLEKRFGPLPSWIETRLVNLTPEGLDNLSLQLLDAAALKDLFPPKP